MKISIKKMKSDLVTIGFLVHAGSYNETIDTLGIAHLTEHLVFRGTEKFNNKQINTYIESLGGYMNAYTNYECTKFYCTVPYNKWKEGIDFLNQIVFHNTIPEKMFDTEKNIVISELKMYQDDPDSVAIDNLHIAMFRRPTQQLVGGTPESVSKISRKQVIDYIKQYYTADNTEIIVTGNINEQDLYNYLKADNTINIYNNNISIFKPPSEINATKADISQSILTWGIKLPNIKSKFYLPCVIVNNYLGGNASSLLYDKVREELGLCYTINTSIENFNNHSILAGYTSLDKNNIQKVKDIIKQVFMNVNISETQLNNNKQYLIGQHLMQKETTAGLNNLITTYGMNFDMLKIKDFTLKDIQAVYPLFKQPIYFSTVTPKEA